MTKAAGAALLAWGIVLLLGCEEGDDLAYYFDSKAYGVPACDRVDRKLEGRRLVRLFTNRDVEVTDASRSMARYYRRHGLTFFTDRPAVVTEMPYALDTDLTTLTALLADEFPGVDPNDEAALMRDPALYARILATAGNFMVRPMVQFAREHGLEGGGLTNLVVLHDLVRPGGTALGAPGASPAGVAISPALITALAAQGTEQAGFWPFVDFPAGFSPMLFVHGVLAGQLSAIDPMVRDLIAAHELGHTTGLVHRELEGNLMAPLAIIGRSRCTDSLEVDQLTSFRIAMGFDSPARALSTRVAHDPRLAVPPPRLAAILRGEADALAKFLAPVFHSDRSPAGR
jgi:hypothetical protein